MAKINDFGEKIGGARKDVWKLRGLMVADLEEMNTAEKQSYVKKDSIWPRPDWVQLVSDGTPQVVAYWQNEMRKSLPPRPPRTDDESIKNYVRVIGEIKDAVMAVKEPDEIDRFYLGFIEKNYVKESPYRSRYVEIKDFAYGIITDKVLKACQQKVRYLKQNAEKVLFGIPEDQKEYFKVKNSLLIYEYDEDNVKIEDNPHDDGIRISLKYEFGRTFTYIYDGEFSDKDSWKLGTYFIYNKLNNKPLLFNIPSHEQAKILVEEIVEKTTEKIKEDKENNRNNNSGKKRKGAFVPPQLADVKREGPKYRGMMVTGNMYLDDLKFRAGEFGNWMDENDRQTSLNMGYDALRDLARILKISPEDISLGGNLAIAFGARGRGGAGAGAAHYEPLRQVINLTKMSGAGCLAHEWGHALDHAIGINSGFANFATENRRRSIPESLADILDAMRYKEVELSVEERQTKFQPEVDRKEKGLRSWIDSVKPRNLSEGEKEAWDAIVKEIIDNPEKFSGVEYQSSRFFGETLTNPEVEALSAIRKSVTNHVIPKDVKIQISLWARDLKYAKAKINEDERKFQKIETDFYKGSGQFDKIFSKAGHGYWQSTCEMFARAFDCYISDKIKEEGTRSDYLTSHADSFVLPDGKGGTIAAIPQGEERKLLNEKFDILIEDLKERGILHDFVEEIKDIDIDLKETAIVQPIRRNRNIDNEADYSHSEQLSFDAMLFGAEERSKNQSKNNRQNNKSHRDYSI